MDHKWLAWIKILFLILHLLWMNTVLHSLLLDCCFLNYIPFFHLGFRLFILSFVRTRNLLLGHHLIHILLLFLFLNLTFLYFLFALLLFLDFTVINYFARYKSSGYNECRSCDCDHLSQNMKFQIGHKYANSNFIF